MGLIWMQSDHSAAPLLPVRIYRPRHARPPLIVRGLRWLARAGWLEPAGAMA